MFSRKSLIVGGTNIGGTPEPPYIVENETAELKVGMVMCVELPALFLEKKTFINMPENVYLITETGFEPLTDMLGPNGVYIKY